MAESLANFRSVFGSEEMARWYAGMLGRIEVPYEDMTITTHFGATHLLAAGPHDAPPVILLHGMEGTAISW